MLKTSVDVWRWLKKQARQLEGRRMSSTRHIKSQQRPARPWRKRWFHLKKIHGTSPAPWGKNISVLWQVLTATSSTNHWTRPREEKFGARRRDAAGQDSIQTTMQDEFRKVTNKLREQETIIKNLKMSNAVQKKKLAQLGADGPGAVTAAKKKTVPKRGRLGGNTLKNYDEWALTEGGFQPAEPSNLKGQYLKSNHNTFLEMYWHQYESGYGDQW